MKVTKRSIRYALDSYYGKRCADHDESCIVCAVHKWLDDAEVGR